MKNFLTAVTALCVGLSSLAGEEDPDLQVLEAFIVEESQLLPTDSLLPTEQVVSGAFFESMAIMETPRAITVLSPAILQQLNIVDFGDLEHFGAGTEGINFFGVPGSPVLRGWQGGSYYQGMLRAFQRNESPTSFGAMESLELVKGPAPAHLTPSHVGGYVNMVPKQPFFDQFRGSVDLEVGSDHFFGLGADLGGPILLPGRIPAAYRISLTHQVAESYYENFENDLTSIYGSVRFRLGDRTRLFLAGEVFNYNSNENAGWNRPTQNLVDTGAYVIGEPLSLVRAGLTGIADRDLIEQTTFGFGDSFPGGAQQRARFRALVVPAAVVDDGVNSGVITAAQRAELLDMADPANQEAVYSGLPADVRRTQSGYLYTPEYFFAGGTVFTELIEGSTVLSDPADFADSENLLFLSRLDHSFTETLSLEYTLYAEHLETDKQLSYGFAFRSEQLVLDNRLSLQSEIDFEQGSFHWNAGAQIRYQDVTQLQDFFVEPFSKREISRASISPNSIIQAGAQINPETGQDFWGSGPSLSAFTSELTNQGLFFAGNLALGEQFALLGSLRYDRFDWDVGTPGAITSTDNAPPYSGNLDEFSWSLNPILTLNDQLSIYGALQETTTFAPTDGGGVLGENNFNAGELAEVGVKISLLEDKLFASLAYYQWRQSGIDSRTGISYPYESDGIELELTWQATDDLTIFAAFTDSETRLLGDLDFRFRTIPFGLSDPTGANDDEIGLALNGGILLTQFSEPIGPEAFDAAANPSNNPDLVLGGSPDRTFKFFGIAENLLFDGFGLSSGFVWRESFYHNFDRTIELPSSLLVSLNLFYKTERWELLIGAENLTDEDYFDGADPIFGAGTLVTKGQERAYRAKLTYNF